MLTRPFMRVNEVTRSTVSSLTRWLPAAIWMGWIFYLSHQSGRPSVAHQIDPNVGHAALYGALAVLCFIALPPGLRRSRSTLAALVAFTLAFLYGVTDEIHQAFVPYRFASATDLVANAVGASGGVTIASVIAATLSRRAGPAASDD